MYSVREALYENEHLQPESVWEDKIVCLHDSPEVTKDFARQRMTDRLSVYSYTIVLHGRLSFVYNGTRVDNHENDMLIYSPGIEIAVHSVSDDYEGMLLAIDDRVALEMPVLRNMIRTALFPVIEHTEPKLTLTGEQRDLLIGMMQTIRRHIAGESAFQEETLKSLCTVFVLDLLNIQQHSVREHRLSERTEEIFISFIRLLTTSFIEHHDLTFYAQELCITTTYLSRIVRQITGRTVISHIHRLLTMEAVYLLLHTDLSITQIADRLHFADTPTFTKFFVKMKGVNPKAFRTSGGY